MKQCNNLFARFAKKKTISKQSNSVGMLTILECSPKPYEKTQGEVKTNLESHNDTPVETLEKSLHKNVACDKYGILGNGMKSTHCLIKSGESDKKKLTFYQSHIDAVTKAQDVNPCYENNIIAEAFPGKMNALAQSNPNQVLPESKIELSRNKHGIVPEGLEYYLLSAKEKSENRGVGRHLNGVYNKIMVLSEEGESSLPKNYKDIEKQFQKGVLMSNDQENDLFAREHKLSRLRTQFDRGFAYWKGKSKMDSVPKAELTRLEEEKSSLLAYHVPEFNIPVLNVDPCPGCGSIFQDENESDFGFLTHEMIHKWVVRYSCIIKNRTEYSERRYRLFCHWAENGKQYGEEWLDFMTHEEFNAFYVDQLQPAVCLRCLALKNFRTTTEDTIMSAPDFRKQLRSLRDEKGLFILVVDLFDFNGSMVKDIQSLISMNNPILIVANKLDKVQKHKFELKNAEAISARQSHSFYRAWIYDQLRTFKFPLNLLKDIVVVSAARGWYISELADKIEQLTNLTLTRAGPAQNAYLVGCTNVGKSSVMNALAKYFSKRAPPHPEAYKEYYTVVRPDGTPLVQWEWKIPPYRSQADIPYARAGLTNTKVNKVVTASPIPGTTIRMIGIPLTSDKKNITLYDTPGLIPEWQSKTVLNLREQSQCASPKQRYLVKYYKMAPGFTLFISGLICIDVIDCHPSGLLMGLYLSPNVTHVRCPTAQSEEMWRQHAGNILKPPYDPNTIADGLAKKRKYFFECEKNVKEPKADIYFHGLGWVTLYSHTYDVVLRVRTHDSVVHGVRSPLSNKELLRRHAALLKKKSQRLTNKESLNPVAQYWPSKRGCVTCHGEFNINAVEPKYLQLVDEPLEGIFPDSEVNDEKPSLLSSVPDIDPSKTPWEDIIDDLKASGRFAE